MDNPISVPQGTASQMTSAPAGGQGAPLSGNGSTNPDGAFIGGDGSLSQLPPDPFTNPEAYGRPIPGQRMSEQIQQPIQQQGQPQQENPLAIEERFAGLPKEEALARSFQSRYDRSQEEIKQLQSTLQQKAKIENFLAEVMDDEQVFEAFVAELRPELIKPKDVSEQIQTALKKEFGEEFEPDDSKVRIPGSKDWLYAKKAEELYTKLTTSGADRILPLKELRALRENQQREQEALVQREIATVKQQMRWDDTQLQGFQQWAAQVKPVDLAQIYLSLTQSAQIRTPFAANHNGSPVAQNLNEERFKRLFGQ
jgi:hypothetical protein